MSKDSKVMSHMIFFLKNLLFLASTKFSVRENVSIASHD
jgi:hypothetical protein